jgi:hypothetical protein
LEGQEVLNFYGIYETEAAELDARIRTLNDENYTDQQLATELEQATKVEAAPAIPDLERHIEKPMLFSPTCPSDDMKRFGYSTTR